MNAPHAPAFGGPLQAAQRLHDARPWSDMDAGLRTLLARQPKRLHTLLGLGALAAASGHPQEAMLWLQAAAAAHPEQGRPQIELARALRQLGRHEDALRCFERAVQLEPTNDDARLMALLQRGSMLDEQGRPSEALACYEQATQQHPDSPDAWAALGMVQRHLHGAEVATASFQRALQIDSTRVDVLEKFGEGLQDQRRHEDAAFVFERLLQLKSDHPQAAGRLMHSKMLIADWTALDALQRRIETSIAAGRLAAEPFGLQGYCESPALLCRAATQFSATYHPERSTLLPPPGVGPGPKIRIGYVSGEFRNQATSVLLTEVLELHDSSRFEITAFDNGWDDGSALRQRIARAVQEIVPIRHLSHLDAARAVRDRGIDILVNLNGHFGMARSHLFALRPAAVQVNYLGFPGTIGAPYIDYLIADEVVVPPDQQAHYVEKLAYLGGCYQPNDSTRCVADTPATRAEAGLPEGAFVFCCLNNVYKITPAVFDVWMRILQRVPRGVLMLYSEAPETQANLRREAQARGIDPQRLLFAGPLPHAQHLARLRLADLFLDTWPYNAHTTGSDALWAGLPVLTLQGATFPSRVGSSLLQAVGLPELVTHDTAAYEELAVELACLPPTLARLRGKLAAQLPQAPLYDTPAYVRRLEDLFAKMYERARAGLPAGCIR